MTLIGQTDNADLGERWRTSFAALSETETELWDIRLRLDLVAEVPPAPTGTPHFRQGELLAYYVSGQTVIAHFPRFGQLTLNLAIGETHGQLVSAALTTYGALEDLLAIGLSPHLRRRGLFLVHAFAAAIHNYQLPIIHNRLPTALLLVGAIGAGKTTTGMSLLNAGWKLLSNDSPVINAAGEVLQYPGLLAAYPETFARFPATARWANAQVSTSEGRKKISVAAEAIWPEVWCERAPARAIVFPQIENRADHALEKLSPPEALRRLLPHAVEQWDTAMMPEHLRVLRLLVERAPAYVLRLGPEVPRIAALLAGLITNNE